MEEGESTELNVGVGWNFAKRSSALIGRTISAGASSPTGYNFRLLIYPKITLSLIRLMVSREPRPEISCLIHWHDIHSRQKH